MAAFLHSLRFAVRLFGKQPGFTAVVVFTFALGIGLTGAMYCLVHGAVRDLPFPEAGRLIHLEQRLPAQNDRGIEVPPHDFLDWRQRQTSFEGLAAFHRGTADLASPGQPPERFRAAFLTADVLRLLRVAPQLGRSFVAGEDSPGAAPVVLLGDELWRHRFGGEAKVLGQTLYVNGAPATVVGILPPGFRFPVHEDVWLPLRLDPGRLRRGEGQPLEVFGRLRDGVSLAQAQEEMNAIARHLASEHPRTNAGVGANLKPYAEEFVQAPVRALLWTMLGAVFGVLLLACINDANLLLARTVLRSQEIAVRAALGAGRRRIAFQVLTETLLTAVAGSLAGLALAAAGVKVFRDAVAPTDPPFWVRFEIDPQVVAFVAGLAVLAALVAGWVPALQASGQRMQEVLKDESRGASSFRLGRLVEVLVIGQIAVTFALLVAAGLMIRTIVNLRTVDYGFSPDAILTARVILPPSSYPAAAERRRFFAELERRLSALPGAEAAALASQLPALSAGTIRFAVEHHDYGRDSELPTARLAVVSPGFLEALRVRPRQGRSIGPEDRYEGLAVAMVNERFAERFFPGESPLGRRIRLGPRERPEPMRTVVGVIPNVSPGGFEQPDAAAIYIPLAQSDASSMSVLLRARNAPLPLVDAMRREVRKLDATLAIDPVALFADVIRGATWYYGVFGILFLIFGGAALFLAAVGLAGVISFAVSRRTHEIGVRRALGAQTADIRRLVLRRTGVQLAAGLLLGLGLALLLSRMMSFILFAVDPWDPAVFLAVGLALPAVCLAACWPPLRRAVRIDPAAALRQP